jgi:hypothetical protein
MSDVKAITIMGSEMNGGHIEKRRSRSRKQKNEGGGLSPELPLPTPVKMNDVTDAVTATATDGDINTKAIAVGGAAGTGAAASGSASGGTGAVGGATTANPVPKKIVLAPKKRQTKIVLTRKHAAHPAAPVQHRPARKLTLTMAGHKRRITRARRLHKESRTASIADIRKKLVEKGVIKETSKAPEPILRQLYADTMTLAQPTL